jgi:ABC-type transport system involved in multi-copper enzyme maturation permease subunit
MMAAIKSELRKILTVRSTYGISLFFLLLTGAISFYGVGYKATPSDLNQHLLSGTLPNLPGVIAFAGAFVALLLAAHEYRYNTIVYTLSASNSRMKVLVAKLTAAFSFTFIYSILVTAICFGLMVAGVLAAGHSLPHQDINYLSYFIKTIFTCEGFAMFALLVPTLVRNMQASVAVLLIVPNTLEALISALIKSSDKWLPFRSLSQVTAIQPTLPKGAPAPDLVSPLHGAVIFLIFLAAGWLIGWYLFLRRDAV